ncbi:hypothetical protein ACOMHN_004231 [Nucella lapillus]
MHSWARSDVISSSSSSLRSPTTTAGPSCQRPRTSVERSRNWFQNQGQSMKVMSAPPGRRIASAPFLGREHPSRGSAQSQRRGSAKKPSSHGEEEEEKEEEGRSCFFCQAEFPDLMSLSRHTRTHGGSAPYSCTRCGRMFALYSSLMTHERSHVPDRSPACRCHRCGATFLHESSLRAHQRRHVDTHDGPETKTYQCVTCHEWVSNEGSLRIHMQRHEPADTARTCSSCGSSFSSDVILRAHVKLHEAEFVTRCVICIRPFRRSRVLLRHSDVHADERQNVCDTCEKRFPKVAEGSWRRMQLLMPGDRQFQCLYCGQRFGRLYQLAAHESGHTDLPPTSANGELHPPVVVVN